MNKPVNIGLFGFGCVGQGLYEILRRNNTDTFRIKKICVKNQDKSRPLPEEYFTYCADDILLDQEIDVVVELIDDAEAAFSLLQKALQQGKHFVTANKKMVACHMEDVHSMQQIYNRAVLYEAAVCGSIPIIRTLEDYYASEEILSLEGIFNGSTNYMLTRVLENGLSFADALTEAQQQGFAEADPSLDVDGTDPKYKLSIALWHAFGVEVKPDQIFSIGIRHVGKAEAEFARLNQFTIKLCVHASRQGKLLQGWVAPQFVPATHHLSNIRHEYNAVYMNGSYAGRQLLVGKGAGSLPTALAVLSDLSSLLSGYRYGQRKRNQNGELSFSGDPVVKAWVRFHGDQLPDIQYFEKVDCGYANRFIQCFIGEVRLHHLARMAGEGASVVLLPESFPVQHLSLRAPAHLQQVA